MNDLGVAMQVIQSKEYLPYDISGGPFRKLPAAIEHGPKITEWSVFLDDVESSLFLENIVELYDVWRVAPL